MPLAVFSILTHGRVLADTSQLPRVQTLRTPKGSYLVDDRRESFPNLCAGQKLVGSCMPNGLHRTRVTGKPGGAWSRSFTMHMQVSSNERTFSYTMLVPHRVTILYSPIKATERAAKVGVVVLFRGQSNCSLVVKLQPCRNQ